MNGRDLTLAFAGLLLVVAGTVLFLSELGRDLGFPVELGVAPIIGVALLALVVRIGQRARPI